MKKIIVSRSSSGWTAAFYSNGTPDKEISSIMGTHILPCPFTAAASADLVIGTVRARNPEAEVVIGQS